MSSDTLIVAPSFDNNFRHNLSTFTGGDVLTVDTSGGGHPSGAIIRAYHENPCYSSYLFVQDSMTGSGPDIVEPFRGKGPVVAWCRFPLFFDSLDQLMWVRSQYRGVADPAWGVFGPVFYATRAAMRTAEPFFPKVPTSKLEAQGTERAWAYCFAAAEIPVAALYDRDPRGAPDGTLPPLNKQYANRQ